MHERRACKAFPRVQTGAWGYRLVLCAAQPASLCGAVSAVSRNATRHAVGYADHDIRQRLVPALDDVQWPARFAQSQSGEYVTSLPSARSPVIDKRNAF
jgi:hypothetical protein